MSDSRYKIAFILEIIRKSSKYGAKLYLDSDAWEDCKAFTDRDLTGVTFGGLQVVLDNSAIYAEVR